MSRPPPSSRDRFSAWRRFSTRWSDNDAYGHVNNAAYLLWFDSAVNAWMIEQGMLDLEDGKVIALVAETGCRYASPLAFPADVEVGIAVDRIGTSSISYRIGVFAIGDDSASAEGLFVHVVVDRLTRRPVPIPDDWRARLASL